MKAPEEWTKVYLAILPHIKDPNGISCGGTVKNHAFVKGINYRYGYTWTFEYTNRMSSSGMSSIYTETDWHFPGEGPINVIFNRTPDPDTIYIKIE